jgi:trehalose 6-phosphate synthase
MWTKESLHNLIKEKMGDYLFVMVSNREPYTHSYQKRKIVCQRGTGGVVAALDPVMQSCNGIWVAAGDGDADLKASDKNGKLSVPPDNPSYTLKRVWLTKEEEDGYYNGYSNETMWPLCHMAFQRPVFNSDDWEHYKKVNEKFARAIIEEVGSKKAFIWIQDYHLCLLPKYLKELAPAQLITAHFWHIPWPNQEVFRICPQKKEILEGLLANDLIGFHIRYHCNNFLDVIDREIESRIDRERHSVVKQGHETLVRPYPISVDFEGINLLSQFSGTDRIIDSLREEFGISPEMKVVFGLDRIDYTKGIPERLLGFDLLLERHPELKEKVVFIQIGIISRLHVQKYKDLNDELNDLVEKINWKHSTDGWKPIILIRRNINPPELMAFYRMGDVFIVSSLHDGMNLVAKEFVSSRPDNKGVLVLSQFTGASRELTDAFLINPYDRDQVCDAIYSGLMLSPADQAVRMAKMRQVVQQNNIYRWAGKILSELLKFEFKE